MFQMYVLGAWDVSVSKTDSHFWGIQHLCPQTYGAATITLGHDIVQRILNHTWIICLDTESENYW